MSPDDSMDVSPTRAMPLDLSSGHVQAWRALLPSDVKTAVPDDADGSMDGKALAFCDAINAGVPRAYPGIVQDHAELLATGGRARRLRFVSWLTAGLWPTVPLASIGEEDDGRGGGRSKLAPLFMSDIDAMAGVVNQRIVKGVADRGTVQAVEEGVSEFEDAFGMQQSTSGGM